MTELVQPGGSGGGGSPLTISDGSTTVPNVTEVIFSGATVSNGGGGIADVSINGGTTTFVDNEIVAGSGTTFTLASIPVMGSEHVYAVGQRLYPTTDFTISGAVITMLNSWNAGMILVDYRK